jgi:hypothetical protein
MIGGVLDSHAVEMDRDQAFTSIDRMEGVWHRWASLKDTDPKDSKSDVVITAPNVWFGSRLAKHSFMLKSLRYETGSLEALWLIGVEQGDICLTVYRRGFEGLLRIEGQWKLDLAASQPDSLYWRKKGGGSDKWLVTNKDEALRVSWLHWDSEQNKWTEPSVSFRRDPPPGFDEKKGSVVLE